MSSPTITYPPIQGGGGAAFNPQTTVQLFDDFVYGSAVGQLNWLTSGTASYQFGSAFSAPHVGVYALTPNNGAASTSILGDPTGIDGLTEWDNIAFDMSWLFKLSAVDDSFLIRIGVAHGTGPFVATMGLKFDASTDTNFIYETLNPGVANHAYDSGIAADTNWHTFRMRSVSPGTILFSLDGGTETSANAAIPSARMSITVQADATASAAGKLLYEDYYTLTITGLTR